MDVSIICCLCRAGVSIDIIRNIIARVNHSKNEQLRIDQLENANKYNKIKCFYNSALFNMLIGIADPDANMFVCPSCMDYYEHIDNFMICYECDAVICVECCVGPKCAAGTDCEALFCSIHCYKQSKVVESKCSCGGNFHCSLCMDMAVPVHNEELSDEELSE